MRHDGGYGILPSLVVVREAQLVREAWHEKSVNILQPKLLHLRFTGGETTVGLRGAHNGLV